jgi:hypothetical protein
MIPKGTSHTSVLNSTFEVQKIKYNPTSLPLEFGNSILLKRGLQISKNEIYK